MKNDVTFVKIPDGLSFRVGTDASPVPLQEWSLRGGGDSGGGIGVLLRLRDEGDAIEHDNYSLLVPWRCVATLTSDELHYIGLPDSAPFGLEVLASGAFHDTDFEIRCGFVHTDGRRVMGAERHGAWLRVGDKDFLLLDPLYSIVEAIEHFRQDAGTDLEPKMLRWGQIAAMLPPDAIVDGHLDSLGLSSPQVSRLRPLSTSEASRISTQSWGGMRPISPRPRKSNEYSRAYSPRQDNVISPGVFVAFCR